MNTIHFAPLPCKNVLRTLLYSKNDEFGSFAWNEHPFLRQASYYIVTIALALGHVPTLTGVSIELTSCIARQH